MSTPESQQAEQRSSVKLVRNAKGDPQWEIRAVAGDGEAIVDECRRVALAAHRELEREFGFPRTP